MTTKASKKSRSSNSYGGKSAKRSHPSYGSNNWSLSYSAAKEDDSDDANSSIASTSFQSAAQESTTSATAIHEVAAAESESIADEDSTTSTTSAAADNVDDISSSISNGGDTDAAASSVSAFDADVDAAPQSSASTEANDNSINNNTLSTILTIDDLPYAYVNNMSLADSLASQKLSSRSHPPSSDKVTFASNIVVDIGVALVATVIIVFAVARGRNGFQQRETSCDHEGEVVTDLEAATAAGGGTAEQQDDGNISDASSIWSADDQAEEQVVE